MDFLSPATAVESLKEKGESAMKASLAKGAPHGFEVGYGSFTINGRMLGHGEPIRVKRGERVLFHVLNGSATEIRSLALPGHTFTVDCPGRKRDSQADARSGALAGYSGTGFCRRGDESSRNLDYGRYGGRRPPSWHGYCDRVRGRERQAPMVDSETVSLELHPLWRPAAARNLTIFST